MTTMPHPSSMDASDRRDGPTAPPGRSESTGGRRRDIVLIMPTDHPDRLPNSGICEHIPGMVGGICDVAEMQDGWTMRIWDGPRLSRNGFIRRWRQERPDGAIVIPTRELRDGPLWELEEPVVALLIQDGPVSFVGADQEAVGALAARHLRASGWTAVLAGTRTEEWWQLRCRGFRSVWQDAAEVRLPTQRDALRCWMAGLPAQTAILADQDYTAAALLEAGLEAGRSFGNDLRLLGVDDELLCRMSRPAISSIRIPWRALGRQAALQLARMLRRDPAPPAMLVPPAGVAARSTCGAMPDGDAILALVALALYRAVEAGSQESLESIIGQPRCSLRTIERIWKQATGVTVMQSLQRIRCEAALHLIGGGMDDLQAVARACGCGGRQNLRRILQRHAGLDAEGLRLLIGQHSPAR